MQSDINGKTGYKKMFNVFNNEDSRRNGIYSFSFTKEDILRSELQKFIISQLENEIV